jgi:hypothetical protein
LCYKVPTEGDIIRDYVKHISHFHTAGNPGRNDLDDTQELDVKHTITRLTALFPAPQAAPIDNLCRLRRQAQKARKHPIQRVRRTKPSSRQRRPSKSIRQTITKIGFVSQKTVFRLPVLTTDAPPHSPQAIVIQEILESR